MFCTQQRSAGKKKGLCCVTFVEHTAKVCLPCARKGPQQRKVERIWGVNPFAVCLTVWHTIKNGSLPCALVCAYNKVPVLCRVPWPVHLAKSHSLLCAIITLYDKGPLSPLPLDNKWQPQTIHFTITITCSSYITFTRTSSSYIIISRTCSSYITITNTYANKHVTSSLEALLVHTCHKFLKFMSQVLQIQVHR